MSVKNFKFVSPGVFINEIDNSFIPQSADVIGPVVIGRAQRGLAMQPVKVQSYSEFVEMLCYRVFHFISLMSAFTCQLFVLGNNLLNQHRLSFD